MGAGSGTEVGSFLVLRAQRSVGPRGYAVAWFLATEPVKLLAYRVLDPVKRGAARTHASSAAMVRVVAG